MHVLIIPSEHFMTSTYPLGGIFQYHQARALHKAGYQVGVMATGAISARFLFQPYHYPEFENMGGYPIFRQYARQFFPQRFARPESVISFSQEIALKLYQRYKKQFGKPDVVHAHNLQCAGMIAQAIWQKDSIPYVITEHSSQFRLESIRSSWILPMKQAARSSKVITAVSRSLAYAVEKKLGIDSVLVLPNILDSFFVMSPLNKREPKNDNDTVFLNIASLDVNKNHMLLMEAFAKQFRGSKVSLRIGGVGPLDKRLRRWARHLAVQDQVHFLGYLDRSSVMREMGAADCFVLSSHHETFGVVLIEALAMGTPVISTRCGGAEEIVNNHNGLLVNVNDVEAMSEAMVNMTLAKKYYSPSKLRSDTIAQYGDHAFVANATRFYFQAKDRV